MPRYVAKDAYYWIEKFTDSWENREDHTINRFNADLFVAMCSDLFVKESINGPIKTIMLHGIDDAAFAIVTILTNYFKINFDIAAQKLFIASMLRLHLRLERQRKDNEKANIEIAKLKQDLENIQPKSSNIHTRFDPRYTGYGYWLEEAMYKLKEFGATTINIEVE